MATVEVTLELPEQLVKEARESDALKGEVVAALLRAEVDRRVMDFVNAEIQAHRAAKGEQKPNRQRPK